MRYFPTVCTSLRLSASQVVYHPQTGEFLKGEPLSADIVFLLAPEEVSERVLRRVDKALRRSSQIIQWVTPSTLLELPKLRSLAYDLSRKVGAIPFLIEGFTHHVLGLLHTQKGFFWRLLSPEGRLMGQGWGLPEEEKLPQDTVVHFRGHDFSLEEALAWTERPLVRIARSHLRFSPKNSSLGTYFQPLPEKAYLHAHPGHPGWPRALEVEVVQGDLPLERVLAQVYWLTKMGGGLYQPSALPLSVMDP